jgi:hypothetical protein
LSATSSATLRGSPTTRDTSPIRRASAASITRPDNERSHGVAEPDHLGQPHGPAPGAEQSERDARFGERRVGRGDPEVAGQRQLDAAATGRAVHAGDDDGRGVLDGGGGALSRPDERLDGVIVGGEVGDDRTVGTGTEGLARPAEVDDRPRRVDDGIGQRRQPRRRERVATVRTVERDDSVRRRVLDADHIGRSVAGAIAVVLP